MSQRVVVVAVMALTYLGLMVLADVATSGSYLILLISDPAKYPELQKVYSIVAAASDVIGQLVMLRVIGARGTRFAIEVNVLNMLAISIIAIISVNLHSTSGYILATIITPLMKCVGGGSHASYFLAFTMLHPNPNANMRSVYFYLTGAVTVLLRVAGANLLTFSIGNRFQMTASIVSLISSILAYWLVTFYRNPDSEPEEQNEDVEPSVTDPLLPPPLEQTLQDIQQPQSQIAFIIREFHEDTGNVFSTGSRNVPYVTGAVFLLASCKPALAMSVLYFYWRIGQFVQVWSLLSLVIYALILPFTVLFLAPRIAVFSNSTLYIGQVSVLIGVLGAFVTGLSTNVPLAVIGSILNTFGSAAALSILAFAANFIPDRAAGRVYLLIAFVESVGSLVGFGLSFSIFQEGNDGDSPVLASPVIYFTCAGIYVVAAILIWALEPIPEEHESDTN